MKHQRASRKKEALYWGYMGIMEKKMETMYILVIGVPHYWEGQGHLVSRLINAITHVVTLLIPIFLTYLLRLPDPPSSSWS